jgi:hypothetical protein
MSWMRRLGGIGAKQGLQDREDRARPRHDPSSIAEWEARLIEEGIEREWAPRLAPGLCQQQAELGEGSARALILGARIATEAQADVQRSLERQIRDVREVERLLGAFSGELEKLDEVLEVLSAYAQRMRAKPAKPARGMLH